MAVVYEAEQLSLGRRVALKILPFAATLDPRRLQRFKNEALAAAQLDHPNIVNVLAVGCERGVHYYAMRYVEGRTLAEAVRELRRPAGTVAAGAETVRPPQGLLTTERSTQDPAYFRGVAQVGIQVAEALDHAHTVGVVHRDIKPSNLLLDERGKAWVTDFGLAHIEAGGTLTLTGDLLGTLRYMSPEQASGQRLPVDHCTDIYSLGVTLYELLTLEPAFPGEERHALLQHIATKEPAPPRQHNPAVPRDLETIVLKAMAKNPAERYATAQELADDLKRFLDDKPIQARRPTLLQRAAKWARRHQPAVGAAILVLVVAVLSLSVSAVAIWYEKERARRERDRAEANFRLALAAVDRYLTQISESPELKARGAEKLRRDLLHTAKEFYRQFVAARCDDPGLEAELGRAYLRLGTIEELLGSYPAALASYQEAATLFDRLARTHPTVPQYRHELARACTLLGSVYRVTGRTPAAQGAYDQACTLLEQLTRDYPGVPAYQQDLARCQNLLGVLYCTLRQPQESEAAYDQARTLLERLIDDHPTVPEYRFRLAVSQANRGDLYWDLDQKAQAEQAFLHALAILRKLAREHPQVPEYQEELARCLNNLAWLYLWTGRGHQAAFDEFLPLLERLVRDHPTVPQYQYDLARAYQNLGWLHCKAKRYAQADDAYRQALPIAARLVHDHPHVDPYVIALARGHWLIGHLHKERNQPGPALDWLDQAGRFVTPVLEREPRQAEARWVLYQTRAAQAEALTQLARYPEALEHWDRAIELSSKPLTVLTWRVGRCLTLARSGAHAEAAAEAEQLVQDPVAVGVNLLDLARAYALAATAARRDGQLGPAERDQLAEGYACRAVALLRRSAASYLSLRGLKEERAGLGESDFDSLRDRDDYRQLVQELEARSSVNR